MSESTRGYEGEHLVQALAHAVLTDVLAHQSAMRQEVNRSRRLTAEQKRQAIAYWTPPTASQRRFYVQAALRALRALPVEDRARLLGFERLVGDVTVRTPTGRATIAAWVAEDREWAPDQGPGGDGNAELGGLIATTPQEPARDWRPRLCDMCGVEYDDLINLRSLNA